MAPACASQVAVVADPAVTLKFTVVAVKPAGKLFVTSKVPDVFGPAGFEIV
jgi:hypothetical protein